LITLASRIVPNTTVGKASANAGRRVTNAVNTTEVNTSAIENRRSLSDASISGPHTSNTRKQAAVAYVTIRVLRGSVAAIGIDVMRASR